MKYLSLLIAINFIIVLDVPVGFAQEPPSPPMKERKMRGPRHGFGRPMPFWDFQLTSELENQALEFLQQHDPKMAEALKEMEKLHPRRYEHMIRKTLMDMRHLERLKERDPQLYERQLKIRSLEREARELGRAFRNSTEEDEKIKLKRELEQLISRLFDLRELNRRDEIARMEAELERLKETIVKRRENKELIVQHRLKQLTGEGKDFEWD